MNTKRILVFLAALLVGTIATGAWYMNRPDPEIVELQEIRERMSDATDEERRATREEFRERIGNLSDDQRRQFFEAGREQMMNRIEERMTAFFALPPGEQQRELDQQIDRMLERRQQRAERGESGQRAGRGGPGGPGDGRARGGGWQNMTEADRDERRKRRLDRTSAKTRAMFSEYRRLMNERLQARGHEPMGRGGPWGRGRPGR